MAVIIFYWSDMMLSQQQGQHNEPLSHYLYYDTVKSRSLKNVRFFLAYIASRSSIVLVYC